MPPPLQPNTPPPPPAIGVTRSAPLNHALGLGEMAIGNGAMGAALGDEINKASFVLNIGFQLIKQIPFINQHFWWPFALLAGGCAIFFIISHDVKTTILNGGAAAFLAAINYHSLRVAGINVLPPAVRFPGAGDSSRSTEQSTRPVIHSQTNQIPPDADSSSTEHRELHFRNESGEPETSVGYRGGESGP